MRTTATTWNENEPDVGSEDSIRAPTSIAIRRSWLAWPYLIVALSIAFVAMDRALLESHFRWTLPDSADEFLPILVLLGTPHVISGLIYHFDREYVRAYRRSTLAFLAIAVPVLAIPGLPFLKTVAILHGGWTAYHHIAQSAGVCRVMLGDLTPNQQQYFTAWKWSLVAAFLAMLPLNAHSVYQAGLLSPAGVLLAASIAVQAHCYLRLTRDRQAALLQMGLTSLSLVALTAFAALGYSFLLGLCARFIHDTTAFGFYVVHDRNRRLAQPEANRLYSLTGLSRVPVWMLCPAVGVALGALTLPMLEQEIGVRILYGIAFFHYFIESKIWRNGAPHRRYISIR